MAIDKEQLVGLLRNGSAHLKSATGIDDYPVAIAMDRAADTLEKAAEPVQSDERRLSDLGNELHNLSCSMHHYREDWADEVSGIAAELWHWHEAHTPPAPAVSVPDGFDVARTSDGGIIITRLKDGGGAYYDKESPLVTQVMAWHFLDALLAAAPQPHVDDTDVVNIQPEPAPQVQSINFDIDADSVAYWLADHDFLEEADMIRERFADEMAAPQPESSRPLKGVVEDMERNPKFAAAIKDGRIWVKSATQPEES